MVVFEGGRIFNLRSSVGIPEQASVMEVAVSISCSCFKPSRDGNYPSERRGWMPASALPWCRSCY